MTEHNKCGAKTRSGEPCQNAAMPNGRCRMHGGKTPVALALPQTRTGRYSKYLPTRLLGRYFEALDDERMLHLHEEIALLDARLTELVGRADAAESGKAWAELAHAWQQLMQWRHDPDFFAIALAEVGEIIRRGNTDYAAWQEVVDLVERRRKLVESERKREIEQKQSVRLDQAMVLVTALLTSVKNHADPTAFASISQDFVRLIGRSDSGRVEVEQE